MNVLRTLALTTLVVPFMASSAEQATLARIKWDMTFEQVKKGQAGKPLDENPTRLTYASHLFDLEFHQEFLFNDQGKLVNVLYYKSFSADGVNCASEYEAIKQHVSKVYGDAETIDKSTRDFSQAAGETLCSYTSAGEYKLDSLWQSSNENISLVLDSWKGTPYVGLSYKPLTTAN